MTADVKKYDGVTRFLHWGMALLLGWQFAGQIAKVSLGREHGLTAMLAGAHMQVGTALFVLIVLRIFWATVRRNARPGHEAGTAGRLAKLGHLTLYGLMLIVPALALLRAWGGERGFAPFGFPIFAPRAEDEVVRAATGLGDVLHGELAWVLLVMILGHIGMALYHHFVKRDGTMKRIL